MAAAVNLTSGAISKIMTCNCTENDIKPVLQVVYIDSGQTHTTYNKKWYGVVLSDGCFSCACFIPVEFFILKKLQKGSVVQLTMFQLTRLLNTKDEFVPMRGILGFDLTIIHSKCDIIGDPKLLPHNMTPLVEKNTPTIPNEEEHVEEPPTSKQKQDHVEFLPNEDIDDVEEPPPSIQSPSTSTQKCSSHSPTSKQKQDRLDPDLVENIDDSRRVEEPPTSKQNQDHADSPINENIKDLEEPLTSIKNPSTSTQNCSSHAPTLKQKQDRVNPDRHVDLTSGAVSKITTRKCTQNDLKPVLQVTYINSSLIPTGNGEQCYIALLSDGSYRKFGLIPEDICISNKLQKGSIVQLTNFRVYDDIKGEDISISIILVSNLIVIHRKCGIIGDLEPLPENETAIVENRIMLVPDDDHVEEPPTAKQKQDHADSPINENIKDVEEPPTSIQNPSTSTQKCFSHSPTLKQKQDRVDPDLLENIDESHHVEEPPTSKQNQDYAYSPINENIKDLEEPPTSIQNPSTSTQKCSSNFPTSKQKQDRVDPDINENIDDSRHVEEPPTSKQKQDRVDPDINENIDDSRHLEEPPTSKQNQDYADSPINENIKYLEEPPTSIQNPSILTQKCSSHSPTSKHKQDRVDPDLNGNIDDSRHVEEPPTSTQECFYHSLTQNKTNTIIGVDLTPGAITKIMTDKCNLTDLKPVVQVTDILSGRISTQNDKRCYRKFVLSDGSSSHFGCIADDIFISNKLLKGSIVQLTKFHFTKYCGNIRVLLINDVNVIHRKCDIIVNPEPFPHNDIHLVERSTPPITDEDHVDVSQSQESVTSTQNCSETQSRKRKHQSSNDPPEHDTNEDVDNSHCAQEPSATTQRCSSHSLTRSKKRKHHSSNNSISKVVSKMARMMIERNKEAGVGSCFKKLETLEKDISKMTRTMKKNKEVDAGFKKLEAVKEDVSKMSRMVMEKSKEDDVGACFKRLGVIEGDVSKLTRMVMEKNKEDDVGACFKKLETLEEDVSELTRMVMEKNKEDDVGACFKKLETLEDVSELTRMVMEKNKEDDVGACFKKLETLEEDVSELTRMTMERNKEDIVGLKKLERLEQDVSKLTRMMMEKNKEDVGACHRKFERLEEDVSKLTRMMMEKNKEDDMGACIEKLDKMGWGAEEPIYETALLLFGQSADYRKLWLHLKPECCGKWVKNAGNMFGLLD